MLRLTQSAPRRALAVLLSVSVPAWTVGCGSGQSEPVPAETPCAIDGGAPLDISETDGGVWLSEAELHLWASDMALTECERNACRERLAGEMQRRLAAEAVAAEAQATGIEMWSWVAGAGMLGLVVGAVAGAFIRGKAD